MFQGNASHCIKYRFANLFQSLTFSANCELRRIVGG